MDNHFCFISLRVEMYAVIFVCLFVLTICKLRKKSRKKLIIEKLDKKRKHVEVGVKWHIKINESFGKIM